MPACVKSSCGPVRYYDGQVTMEEVDLLSNAFGFPWGQVRTYNNRTNLAISQSNGNRWFVEGWPFLVETMFAIPIPPSSTSSGWDVDSVPGVEIIWGANQRVGFQESGPIYEPVLGEVGYLVHDSGNNEFLFTDRAGNVTVFNDFDVTSGQGQIKEFTTSGGVTISFTYTGGLLKDVQRHASGTDYESFAYTHVSGGVNDGFVASVTWRRGSSSTGPWTNIRKVEYDYYVNADSYGSDNELKTAVVSQFNGTSWDELSTRYYRYYTSGQGSEGRLQYVLSPEAFQKLDDAVADPFAASNATVAQYADFYYEYDEHGRVSLEQIKAGSEEYTFAYTDSSNEYGPNSWDTKTVVTNPDNSQDIVFTNYAGSTMLRVLKDGGDEWCWYTAYDFDNRAVLQAEPSAISGYSEGDASLLGYDESTGTATSLNSSSGLIRRMTYTTAGFVSEVTIQEGQSSSEILVSKTEYTEHKPTGSDESIWLPSKTIEYPDADTNPTPRTIETSYSYVYYTGTDNKMKVKQRTTTLPVISTAHNGSGTANTRVEEFDIFNNLTKLTNEKGVVTEWVYDNDKGGVTQMTQDSGTGTLNLVTDYTLDDLGRVTQELGPAHDIDLSGTMTEVRTAAWTVYDDVGYEVRIGQGYQQTSGSTNTLVNPVGITTYDRNGNVLEEIQATRASTSGKLLPTDTFSQTSYVRWSTSQYTDCCRASSRRVYHTIPTSGTGSSGTNYDQTDFGYDSIGRRNRVQSPGGTIVFTVYDARGLAESVYVGTNDDGATETDPTGGGSDPDNNMVVVTTNEYDDGNDGGNGNLTTQTQHVDSSSANDRVVEYTYDFRNRVDQTSTSDGTTTYLEVPAYDNMSRITKVERYHTSVSAANLTSKQEQAYDDLSRVYETTRYGVNPSTGAVNSNTLVSDSWYDPVGNLMKQAPAGSELYLKLAYDAVDRLTDRSVGYARARRTPRRKPSPASTRSWNSRWPPTTTPATSRKRRRTSGTTTAPARAR